MKEQNGPSKEEHSFPSDTSWAAMSGSPSALFMSSTACCNADKITLSAGLTLVPTLVPPHKIIVTTVQKTRGTVGRKRNIALILRESFSLCGKDKRTATKLSSPPPRILHSNFVGPFLVHFGALGLLKSSAISLHQHIGHFGRH